MASEFRRFTFFQNLYFYQIFFISAYIELFLLIGNRKRKMKQLKEDENDRSGSLSKFYRIYE